MKLNRIIFSLLLFSTCATAQRFDTCMIIKNSFDSSIKKRYQKIFVANRLLSFDKSSQSFFQHYLVGIVPKGVIDKICSNLNPTVINKANKCFNDSQLYDPSALLSKLNRSQVYIDTNLAFVQFVNKKQAQIAKETNPVLQEKLLNSLTSTEEFKRFNDLLDFNTPRLIQMFIPISESGYYIVPIKIIKRNNDDYFWVICIFKRIGRTYKLIKKISFS